jgi:DtxR family Mn-dependent transcriptional regulator
MTTGNREDYLINILRLTEKKPTAKTTELASFMDVTAASVSEMLSTLSKEGMVVYQKYKGASLTEKGKDYAEHIRKKHHIMEYFLINVLDTDHITAHEEACRMEHVISDKSAMKMCQIIGYDERCSDCRDECDGIRTVSLASMGPMTGGIISYLRSRDSACIRKLISVGLVPGKRIRKGRDPVDGISIIHIGDIEVAVERGITDAVFVDAE